MKGKLPEYEYSDYEDGSGSGNATAGGAAVKGGFVPAASSSAGDATTHKVLLAPTGSDPQFITVSGDKGIYASLFDLDPGQWTVAVKIVNEQPPENEVMVVRKLGY